MIGGDGVVYPRIGKPYQLTELHDVAQLLFEVLREAFGVPTVYEMRLHDVDAGTALGHEDQVVVAAFAMRETQALRRAAATGVPVTNLDVVNVAVALHAAIDSLIAPPADRNLVDLLRRTRDQVNEAARVAAGLGIGHEGGIVELA